jgi:hypothetical protein
MNMNLLRLVWEFAGIILEIFVTISAGICGTYLLFTADNFKELSIAFLLVFIAVHVMRESEWRK